MKPTVRFVNCSRAMLVPPVTAVLDCLARFDEEVK